MTKAEKEHYGKLARLGCILCIRLGYGEGTPSEIHHIRRFGGKRSNTEVIPLCPNHHRLGDTSVHQLGHKGFEKYWGFSEEDLLEKLNDLLQKTS
jgi:hypothetical protein